MTFLNFFRSVNDFISRSNGETSRHENRANGPARAAASCGTKACAHREIASTGGWSAQKGTPSNRGMVGHDDTKGRGHPRGTNVSSPRPANASPDAGRLQLPAGAAKEGRGLLAMRPATAPLASLAPSGARGRPLTSDEREAYRRLYPAKRERVSIP